MGMMISETSLPPAWQRVAGIFDAAIALPADGRDEFIARECAGDGELLVAVRRLLRAHAREGILDRSPRDVLSSVTGEFNPHADHGGQIGGYHVLRTLGSGGMGDVYLAERVGDGFQQRVAIKVLRQSPLGDSGAMVQRFLAERGLLARLNHPNIPRFLDGGLTRDGAPWFAMEYVEGMPIDRHCDDNNLSLRQRLALFTSVCEAIQYAHQHLVVHRDLKPSNIQVTPAGVVKVLDFGIAKILDGGDGSSATKTLAGQRWMTPEYASPEQVRGDVVTTATDVFALGIVLYELVACRRPYVGKTRYEVERAILETEPLRPSAALPEIVCVDKGFDPAKLRRELAGDVDTIALKALNKDAARRYRTAGELADDIRRYLAGLPVQARSDTFGYRARK